MSVLEVSCSKETGSATSLKAKAKAKTETVSFSVGISQEDTKAYFERTDAKEWTAKFSDDKIWVKATDGSGTVLSSSEFTGGEGWSYPQNVFKGEWTYPEEETTYSVIYPSSLGKNGILDLRHQDSYNQPYALSLPGICYALRGDVEGIKSGDFPKTVALRPLVAILKIFPDSEINLVVKDSKGAYVTGIDSEGKTISSFDISQEEAVLFSSRDITSENPGVIMVVVPAGEKLTFYNGDKELKTTKDSGLKAGSVVSLSGSGVGLDVKIELYPDAEVSLNSATVKGRIKVEGSESTPSITLQLGYNIYPERATAKHFFTYHHWPYEISGSSITLDKNGYFTVTIPELRESTTYYYIVRAIVNATPCYQYDYFSETMSFTTLEPQITVETRAPKYVGFTEAELDSYLVTSTFQGQGSSFIYSKTAKTRDEIIATGKSCGKTVSGLEKGTTYYYIAVGSAGSVAPYKVAYGDVMSFTTKASEAEVGEAVDLGLSVKWRSCNLGTAFPTTKGNTFCWGETSEPLSGEKYNKYNCEWGKEVLDLEDDTAHYILGGKWRMPTYEEFNELIDKCLLTYDSGKSCIIIRSNVPGHTDNSIILPRGVFWSSTLLPMNGNWFDLTLPIQCHWSYSAIFNDDTPPYHAMSADREQKYNIRPVQEK